jgi:hypothetical protein
MQRVVPLAGAFMYISSVALNNFRCYRQTDATLVHPGAKLYLPREALNNVTLLIGTNGSGKTSVLRAVALGVLAPVINESGYRPYYLVRRVKASRIAAEKGWVAINGVLDEHETTTLSSTRTAMDPPPDALHIHIDMIRRKDYDIVRFSQLPGYKTRADMPAVLSNSGPEDLQAFVFNHNTKAISKESLTRVLNEYFSDFSQCFFMLGYGATRRVEVPQRASFGADKDRGRRYLRAAGLFEESVTLFPLAGWLPQLRKSPRYKEIVQLLNKTLPASIRFTGRFLPDQQPLFAQDRVELPFPALSDGYRSYIGVLGDMLHHLHGCAPKGRPLTDLSGVVMIDDIDLHLHPKWQRVVVPRMAKAFPRLQFILTTHSPLVAGSVHAANVRVIGKNRVHQFAEQLNGLSVDQILSSPYFGYTKPRSDAAEKKLKKILEGPIDEGDAGPALEFLKALTGENSGAR